MATPTIMVQALGANNDPVEGPNGPVFLTDIAAVAQIIATTLKLLRGEWWENLTIGFPLFQNLIGASNSAQGQAASQVTIENTIRSCPYVQQILTFAYLANSSSRGSAFTCNVLTAFGVLTVTNAPGASATVTS
jgi:hypothetical protein